MAISASAVAPPGDAPVRFPDTRAAKQPTLSKQRQGAGEEGTTSSLLQVAVVSTFLLVKWARVWWEARRKAKAAPPPAAHPASMAEGADMAPLYKPLYDFSSGFVLGGAAAQGAGAAGDWERRRDAPTAMRIAIGDDGELQAPPVADDAHATSAAALRAALPVTNGAGSDFIALPADVAAWGEERGAAYAEVATPAAAAAAAAAPDAARRKSAPAALQAAAAAEVVDAPARRSALAAEATPPWWPHGCARTLSRLRSPLLRLHQEIVDFCRFTEPTAAEAAARAAAVARVRAVVTSIWPGAKLSVFGSFATGLYLPTSDIDAVILDSKCNAPGDGLRALALALARRGVGRKIALIAKARIPIVKFEECSSGFAFDVSFDVANGPAAAEWMRQQMAALPPLRPLSLVLKAFLQQRELNEVYTGGVSSYALMVMIIAHLRTHPACGEEPNLGVLLLDFLELYGRQLHCEAVGVAAESFLNKAQRGWADERRPDLFAVEDPREAANDLGRNSYNARAIRSAFDHAHRLLSAPAATRTESLLGRIVHLDAAFLGRPRLEGAGAIAAVAASLAALQAARRKRRRARLAAAAAAGAEAEEEAEAEEAEADDDAARARKQRNRKGKRERKRARAPPAEEADAAGAAEEGEVAPPEEREEGELEEEAEPPATSPPRQRKQQAGRSGRRDIAVSSPEDSDGVEGQLAEEEEEGGAAAGAARTKRVEPLAWRGAGRSASAPRPSRGEGIGGGAGERGRVQPRAGAVRQPDFAADDDDDAEEEEQEEGEVPLRGKARRVVTRS